MVLLKTPLQLPLIRDSEREKSDKFNGLQTKIYCCINHTKNEFVVGHNQHVARMVRCWFFVSL